MKKRLWAVFLTICLVAALLPTTALAADQVLQGYCGADDSYESQTYNYSNATQTFTGTYYSNAVWTITENGTMPSDSTKPVYKLTISGTGAIGDFGTSWSFGRPWHFELINNNIAVTDARLRITAIEISDGITEIGAHTFEAYPNVTSIVIPDSVTKIGEKAFNSCKGATSITLGSGLREIGKTAFSDCNALTTISFPDKLETIGESAFSGCNNLSGDLVIPDSVKTIGKAAFANDTNLTGTLTIGSSVASIGNSAFSGCKFTGALSIPDSVTSIGDSAFTNCNFTKLSLGNGLTEIGKSALNTSGTYSGHLSIPDSVTTIGKTAFSGVGFSSISLGKAVSTIGQSAFANCTSIHSLDITAVSSSVTYGGSEFHSLRNPNTIYVNSDPQKSAISAAITDGRTAFAITNGGTFPVTTQFSADQLATPVKDGCIFGGWYTDESCETKFTGTPAANSTYYAKWEAAAASVNGVGYGSLADAINAASNGETVKLLSDVTANVTIPADETITLDLNGKNIAVTSGCAIVNKGTLTVTGSGNVTTSADESAAVANFPGATANLNGGTYSSSNWYVIKNLGTMTIDGHVTVKKPDGSTDTSSLIDNGWYGNATNDLSQTYPTSSVEVKLTIKNGAFEGKSGSASCSVVKNDDYGVLEITGGTFDSTSNTGTSNATTILNWNVATISGGTFKGSYPISNGAAYNNEADQGLLTISGGNFIGTISLFGQAQDSTSGAGMVTITDGNFEAPQFGAFNYAVEISGGTFSFDPSTKVKNNGTDYIVKRDGSEGAYTYTVLAKSGLTSGVYLTDPSGALANNYYVSSTANGVWTVSYSAPYSGGSSSYDPTYSVSTPSKTENGSVTVSPKNASKGDRVTVTVKPDAGYVLGSLEVKDANGNTLSLTDKGNGKYTFTMPASKVEIKATFVKEVETSPFSDVSTSAYYYEAVKWAQEKGITGGIGNGLFGPNQPCTRAQIVTFLWRAAGSPEPKSMSGFSDVSTDSYYAKAVAWAVENGITTGTGDGKFSPDATCTRAQSVTFLYRAMGTAPTTVNGFTDVAADSFCADAVAWAVENGVTNGTSASAFSPSNGCTRAQIVTFLFRAYQGK